MDGATLAAVILDAITVPASGAAIWVAWIAKGDAKESKVAAAAAGRTADAMEEQVKLLKDRFAAEERDRLAPFKPRFIVESGEVAEDSGGQPRVGIRITQDGGVALKNVKLTVSGPDIEGIGADREEVPNKLEIDFGPSVDGTVHRAWIAAEYNSSLPLSITLRIDAKARDSEEEWPLDMAVQADRPPERVRRYQTAIIRPRPVADAPFEPFKP